MNITNTQVLTKREEKKRQLVLAAAKIFSEKGYMDCTIRDITEECNIAVGSFYTYFSNKEEALTEIYEELLSLSLTISKKALFETDDTLAQKITKALSGTALLYIRHNALTKLLFTSPMGINKTFIKKQEEITSTTTNSVKELLASLRESGSDAFEPLDVTAVLLTDGLFGIITAWLKGSITCSLNEMLCTFCRYHLTALGVAFTPLEIEGAVALMLDAAPCHK